MNGIEEQLLWSWGPWSRNDLLSDRAVYMLNGWVARKPQFLRGLMNGFCMDLSMMSAADHDTHGAVGDLTASRTEASGSSCSGTDVRGGQFRDTGEMTRRANGSTAR